MCHEITEQDVRARLPERPEDSHKGRFGHVFILAGSEGFIGAAKLCALGAGRSGAGLVTVGTPCTLLDSVAAGLLEAMTHPLPATPARTLGPEAVGPALEFAEGKQAVVLGPGLSQQPETQSFVRSFVARCPAPLLLDADGLNALADNLAPLLTRTVSCIVTPHPGEMARLCGCATAEVQAARVDTARRFAAAHGCVAVLKGRRTVVAAPDGETFVNPTGNPGLAKGGTGDVLAGLAGGLLAQGMSPLDAAVTAVYVHGITGDLAAAARTGRGMTAGDLIEMLPLAWLQVEGRTHRTPVSGGDIA